jgi:AcrR family transcriptional regulator
MARGRASGYDAQAEFILQQAAELFATRGYIGTSMNEVAQSCGLSKATLYHYYRDKYAMLVQITEGHVRHLHALVQEVTALQLAPSPRLDALIQRFVLAYAGARHAHRVLTEDVRFLEQADRERVLGVERELVAAIADAVAAVRPDMREAHLAKPLTMLLFGMINWMFTWMNPQGRWDHDTMAPIVAQLFLGGLQQLHAPEPSKQGQLA